MKHKITILFAMTFFIVGNGYGILAHQAHAASNETNTLCSTFTLPDSNKVYLFAYREHQPRESIAQLVRKETALALDDIADEVIIVQNSEQAKADGLLLKIKVLNIARGNLFTRIDFRYELIENTGKAEILNETDVLTSNFGFKKLTGDVGREIVRNITPLIDCFEARRQ
ncbi:MAG: hypothetical protein CMK46_02400 [Porticoccus sp.]|jgi:hypothetical protein|uniref:hypothetical protein n=1 Tax=Porticoccus TaxID=1123967 RepID=UPI00055F9CFA|nr:MULTISPECIES: hypothetical protein [Porticoccus]MAZ69481.1 hypothetical protein [Porticoccus sp.]MBG57119.1 hypothetical protein [Porticoccus sp.]|tara:strand:+ start:19455 stop:19964 length:510 start_codon:yes stop_codon:yes gene_type:complete